MFFRHLIIVFGMAFFMDIVATVHVRALTHNRVLLSLVTVILVHYLSLFSWAWFADESSWAHRFWLASASAWGAALGTLLVLWLL